MFCISARDAHKMEGRFRSEKGNVFSSIEHTQILQLRQHVHSLTGGSEPAMRAHSALLRVLLIAPRKVWWLQS